MINQRLKVCAVTVLLSIALTAQAELELFISGDAGAVIQGERVVFAKPPLFLERGTREAATLVPEPGRNVPLRDAVRQLLPVGWKARLHPAVEPYSVNWEGGYSWLSILQSTLGQIGADALVDWSRQEVVIGPEVRRAWVLTPGSLKDNLRAWAERAGWHLRWEVAGYADLTVPFPTVLPLGLDMIGAVRAVVDSYRQTQMVNLKADFFTLNQVMVLRCDQGGC